MAVEGQVWSIKQAEASEQMSPSGLANKKTDEADTGLVNTSAV
jgi:hypothetical protein